MIKKIIFLLLILLFLFTRFYNISQSLFFYNDMGRDLLVLLKWLRFGDLPILGPQTSALPINQSPIYYYLLLPFYLLTGKSPYSALVMNVLFYLLAYGTSIFLTRSAKTLNQAVHLVFLLMVFHPQFIIQNRYVWNPSLLPPLIFVGLILFLLSFIRSKKKLIYYSIIIISLSVSIHYSAITLLLSLFFVIFLTQKNFFVKTLIVGLISLFIFNITTVIQLIKRLFTAGVLFYPQQVFQTGDSLQKKASDFIYYGLGLPQNIFTVVFLIILLIIILFSIRQSKNKNLRYAVVIFIINILLTVLSPFNLQAHYIFAITITFFVFVSLLNWKLYVPIVLFLLFFYINPQNFNNYFRESPRTYQQMDRCFKNFCGQFRKPVFVSVQSDLYPYHFGPEHRYLMLKNNCRMKEIEEDNNAASHMAVVLDSGNYSEKTSYYELDLFGNRREIKTFQCQNNFKIVLLEKTE